MIEKQRQNAFHATKCVVGLLLKSKTKRKLKTDGAEF